MKEKEEPDQEQKETLLKEEKNDAQDIKNTSKKKTFVEIFYDENKNISYGASFLGRMIMTFYSLHGLFFCYNLVLQYFLLIPGFLFTINNLFGKIFLSVIYISYSLCLSNILVIPTFEFLTFPFLRYPNSLSHLISFVYIYKEKKFNHEKIIHQNQKTTFVLNIIFYVIEGLYIIGYALSFFSKFILLKDMIKCIILILVYLNYFAIYMNYVFVSFYLIIKILFSKPTKKIIIDIKEGVNLKKFYLRKI